MMSKKSSCGTEKLHSGHAAPKMIVQMRENGKRRLWLFALLSFMMLLCYPLRAALTLNRYAEGGAAELLIRQGVGHDVLGLTSVTVFLLTAGGILCAAEGFSWIYSRRKIDMYLSQPITAGRRFAMTYLNGILLYFIPYLVSVLLSLLVTAGAGAATGALFVNVLFTLPAALVYFLAVYNLTLFAMMLAGKRGMAGFFAVMCFLYDPLFGVLLENYCGTYFSTYLNRAGREQYLSPICRVIVMLDQRIFPAQREAVQIGDVVEKLAGPMLPGVLVLLAEAILFGAAAYLCYKKRPMEAAAQAVAFPAIKGPVKVLLMVFTGLLGSEAFCDIAGNKSFFVAFPGLILGILFCQALMEILYEGDLKAFHRHRKSFAAGAAAALLIYLFFAFDLSGYDTWVPKEEKVESAAIEITFGNQYNFSRVDENGEWVWDDDCGLDSMEMTDVSSVLSLASDGMGRDALEQDSDTRIRCKVKYTMKDGRKKYRSFFIDYEKEKTVLDILFANEEYKEGTNQVLSEKMDWIFGRSRAYYDNGMQEREIVDKNVLPLLQAYRQDLWEMSFTDIRDAVPCGVIKLRYRTDNLQEYELEYPVFSTYTKTVEYLRGKNIDLYLNINPEAVESIRVGRYGEDSEVVEKESFFGTAVSLKQTAGIAEEEYTQKAQIGEILGSVYPDSLAKWVYLPEILEENIFVTVQEADNTQAWYYDWNGGFLMKKGEVPEFVREDLGGE